LLHVNKHLKVISLNIGKKMTQNNDMTPEEQKQWVREQYQVATKYLAEQGLVTDSVLVEESRYIVPIVAVWKLKAINGQYFWVICGDLPTDFSKVDVAKNPRDAIRHFSFKWQMQAENLFKAAKQEQTDFAELLVSRAEGLYSLYEDDKFWNDKS